MWWRKPRMMHGDFGHHASAGEPPPHPRGRFAPALTIGLCLFLSACGFHPLYSKSGADPNLSNEMSQIAIEPMRDRQGQEIHNALIKTITPEGPPEKSQSRYRLYVAYTVTESSAALATDETATRDVMRFNVLYRLYEGGTTLTAGTFPEIFSYNFLQEHYANVSAQSDIMTRVSDQIALEVRNRLAIYFTNAAEQKAKAAAAVAADKADKTAK